MTKIAGVKWDPDATCPNFEAHVRRVANFDDEVERLIWWAIGMTLVGHDKRKSHGFLAVWGEGGNGKGTLARALRHVFGDYGHELPARELTKNADRHSTSIYDLRGKRLVTVSEMSRANLDPDRVMYLTGGDDLTARPMRRDNVTFPASHTLWVFTNKLPRLGDVGEAARRRYRPIKTGPPLKPAEKDPEWEDKLQAEAAGVLRRAVEANYEWQDAGFRLPEPKSMATLRDEHLNEQDEFDEWADDCVIAEPGACVPSNDIINSFTSWRAWRGQRQNLTKAEVQDLYEWLRAHDYEPGRASVDGRQQRVRRGLKLQDPALLGARYARYQRSGGGGD